jgi:hypothetical protein
MWGWNGVALLGMYRNWSTSSLTHLGHAAGL